MCCSQNGASRCIADAASCADAGEQNVFVTVCESAADCPEGQVCCAGVARSTLSGSAGCRPPPDGGSCYERQRCAQSCECLTLTYDGTRTEQTCVAGRCEPMR